MGKGFQGAMLRAMRVEEHTATVIESEWLTQHVVHITFHSDTLLNNDGELPASWVRVWFPDHEGQGTYPTDKHEDHDDAKSRSI